MKIDRLFSIVNILINNKNVTAPFLAEKFNVSVRTIYRDIDVLSENGVPVYCTQGKGGGIYLMDGYSIDKTMLSDNEQKQVLAALQGLNATGKVSVDESLSKLKSIFKKDEADWIEIDFPTWEQSDKDKQYFDILKNCILNKKVVSFDYFSNKGEKTTRIVEPYKLVFKGYSWYVYGFCRSRKDFRFFKLCRIDNLSVTSEKYAQRKFKQIKYEYNNYASRCSTIHVKMKIDISAASRVYDEFRNGPIELIDDKFIVSADLRDDDYLYNYLFSYGDRIEVLEPVEVRDKLKSKISNMLKKYL
ncbi:helix-turn-helix transcriptional regulator [Inconstantimicrobium porci]|uniref:YafY family transcriptional regulator n=3 Tax=Inconstantimicrobium porci TaxID=2652291 RepID=A0A7X2T1I4_9CLOT|nr:YafY family protein [Inconstantimicrobium porci]MSR91275.1 YafY family transcriptional regulator [Inconstantimicrobium porci]